MSDGTPSRTHDNTALLSFVSTPPTFFFSFLHNQGEGYSIPQGIVREDVGLCEAGRARHGRRPQRDGCWGDGDGLQRSYAHLLLPWLAALVLEGRGRGARGEVTPHVAIEGDLLGEDTVRLLGRCGGDDGRDEGGPSSPGIQVPRLTGGYFDRELVHGWLGWGFGFDGVARDSEGVAVGFQIQVKVARGHIEAVSLFDGAWAGGAVKPVQLQVWHLLLLA